MIYIDKYNNKTEIPWSGIEKQLQMIADTTEIVVKRRYKQPNLKYWNIPAAFDIETTSTYVNDKKEAWMYEWTFGIGDYIWIGRTWDEYLKLTRLINNILTDANLFVGVHNLAFEFQFIRKYFGWAEVFSNQERHPIRALTDNIEYRCTASISALPLSNLAKNLVSHKIEKLEGDLDYSIIRTSDTELTDEELQYCINDVRIILYYLEEQIEQCGNISKIPLTNTGRVREYCKKHCLQVIKKDGSIGRNHRYINEIHSSTLTPELYINCKLAFRGGFTHANPLYNGLELENVTSYDLTSAYPSVMIMYKYPFGTAEKVEPTKINSETFKWYIDNRCCLFKATFINLRVKHDSPDTYISWIASKMHSSGLKQLNNGRVTEADELSMYMTEIDYDIISRTYEWDELYIDDMYVWYKRYLNKEFIKCILKFYKDKTTLKGTEQIVEYLMGKGMLNACYGMLVMDICRDDNDYNDDWVPQPPMDITARIEAYNNASMRFTYYPVGLWVTGYCRKTVWDAILAVGDDYVYSDTDSIKLLGEHSEWFATKNKEIEDRVHAAMDYHSLDYSEAEPLTINGEKKLIGVWDREGTYDRFKTLGCKRYLTQIGDDYELTCAGVSKSAVKYLKTFKDPFKEFNMTLHFPSDYTGKLTHTYIDEPFKGLIRDYQGNVTEVEQKTSIHLEPTDYSLSEDDAFQRWLDSYREIHQRG